MNQQCDKVSNFEFVAIQFGVKFSVMYILQLYQLYVDRVCQRYPHDLILFRKLCYFTKDSMVSSLFYFFSRSFYIILYIDLQPWEAILNSEGNPIGHSKYNATSRPSTKSTST